MRALRIFLIVVVILGGLFVIADRVAVHFAEGQAADKLRATENLAATPDVSIKGFPFLTQVAGGSLDDVEVGIKDYEAATGNGSERIRIDDLKADMKGVDFSGDYSSATAADATGTATIAYDQLLSAVKNDPVDLPLGATGKVTSLSYGGNGKVRATVVVAGVPLPVLGTVTVQGDTVKVHADGLPKFGNRPIDVSEVKIGELPGGIKLDKVQAAQDGVKLSVKGSNVRLAG
ncbi:DUF2993 domain-containing protein [Streptomyces sp. NPDC086549]|uniref:LmeA family phospholipid-binding protein n=1 Tax=Streptomyces sp. NPDC086549 TaxID=3365752 RepID=UPI00381C01B9